MTTLKTEKTEAEWRESLTPEEYRVLRKKGTEAPFTGTYWNHHADGTYTCAACGQEARVPFQPSGDKPVYCSKCFEQRRGSPSYSGRGRY